MALKKSILFLLKVRTRLTHRDYPLDFCSHLRNSNRLLVSLPKNSEERKAAQRYIKKLPSLFPDATIYYLYQNGHIIPKNIPVDSNIIVGKEQLRYRFYPSRTLRSEISKLDVDVFIDFNKNFDFVSTVLAASSQAKVRICLKDNRREPFFNLQIKGSPESPGSKGYKSILSFLESCRSKDSN